MTCIHSAYTPKIEPQIRIRNNKKILTLKLIWVMGLSRCVDVSLRGAHRKEHDWSESESILFISSLVLSLQFTYVISLSELHSILSYQTSFWVMAAGYVSVCWFLIHALTSNLRQTSLVLRGLNQIIEERIKTRGLTSAWNLHSSGYTQTICSQGGGPCEGFETRWNDDHE